MVVPLLLWPPLAPKTNAISPPIHSYFSLTTDSCLVCCTLKEIQVVLSADEICNSCACSVNSAQQMILPSHGTGKAKWARWWKAIPGWQKMIDIEFVGKKKIATQQSTEGWWYWTVT